MPSQQLNSYSPLKALAPVVQNRARPMLGVDGHGCASVGLHLWMLKVQFHIIFTCHKICSFLFFLLPFVHVKRFLAKQQRNKKIKNKTKKGGRPDLPHGSPPPIRPPTVRLWPRRKAQRHSLQAHEETPTVPVVTSPARSGASSGHPQCPRDLPHSCCPLQVRFAPGHRSHQHCHHCAGTWLCLGHCSIAQLTVGAQETILIQYI